ncbi:TetR family transcriptional regulator [Streptomyces erythrochromogenes]|uniref:TetR family transcriptional regulator n=2 Tax=Streptomyces erythrochromogenes TaxID=285574 RepID=UPI0022586725|nr:TetR family transcriptional regulator [Streptomyces erythrochromogenes]MCX5583255.1 TetR family transcriptional regulator [Streptomyces erythrochromogenes]
MAAARHRIEVAALTGDPVPDPPRVAWRKQMRQRVLDAARDLTCEAGWDQVSLLAVAVRAEVSRPSVYKEFGNRAGLGRALVVRETQQFLAGVADALYPGVPDSHACLRVAILYVLQEADNQPLIRAVITAARKGSDSLLPYLTARADPIFDAGQTLVQGWLATRYPHQHTESVQMAADVIVRMTISHLILPTDEQHLTAQRLATAALKLLQ